MDIVVCSIFYDSLPKIWFKKRVIDRLAQSTAIHCNISYRNPCILIFIESPNFCQHTVPLDSSSFRVRSQFRERNRLKGIIQSCSGTITSIGKCIRYHRKCWFESMPVCALIQYHVNSHNTVPSNFPVYSVSTDRCDIPEISSSLPI